MKHRRTHTAATLSAYLAAGLVASLLLGWAVALSHPIPLTVREMREGVVASHPRAWTSFQWRGGLGVHATGLVTDKWREEEPTPLKGWVPEELVAEIRFGFPSKSHACTVVLFTDDVARVFRGTAAVLGDRALPLTIKPLGLLLNGLLASLAFGLMRAAVGALRRRGPAMADVRVNCDPHGHSAAYKPPATAAGAGISTRLGVSLAIGLLLSLIVGGAIALRYLVQPVMGAPLISKIRDAIEQPDSDAWTDFRLRERGLPRATGLVAGRWHGLLINYLGKDDDEPEWVPLTLIADVPFGIPFSSHAFTLVEGEDEFCPVWLLEGTGLPLGDKVLPLNLKLTGWLLNGTLAALLIFSPWTAFIAARHHRRIRKGLCPACGYDTKGVVGSVCPECGGTCQQAQFDSSDLGLADAQR